MSKKEKQEIKEELLKLSDSISRDIDDLEREVSN